MSQSRNRGQQLHPLGRFLSQTIEQAARTDLLAHPALEDGLGGHPQIEIGVELTAEAFDIEKGLLQQDELRLDLDIESAGGLKKPHQDQSERDLLERPVEEGFAHRADRAFELFDPGV